MSASQYGAITIVGTLAFVVGTLALHVLDSDVSVMDHAVSDYALGDYGWLARTGDVANAVTFLAIALGLRLTLAPRKSATASWVLFLIATVGATSSGIFVTDGTEATSFTTEGAAHAIAGIAMILALVAATWTLRAAFRHDEGFRHLQRAEHWFAVVITIVLVVSIALEEVAAGLAQRILIMAMVAWWLFLAVHIRRAEVPLPR